MKDSALIDTGGFFRKDRITHRIELTKPPEFNAFAKDCLKRAYQPDS